MDTEFDDLQRRAWRRRRRHLVEEYEAIQEQSDYALDSAQRLRLERQAQNIAQRIRALDENLAEDNTPAIRPASPAASPTPPSHNQLVKLVDAIRQTFSPGELEDLCFRLDVDAADIAGATHSEKTRGLVLLLQRHNRLPDLMVMLQKLRPTVNWEQS
jgi:hypothetical protein